MKKNLLILYGSTTGNSERLAYFIKDNLKKEVNISIYNVANVDYPYSIPNNFDLVLLCTSTWGIDPASLQEDFEYWHTNTHTKSIINKNFYVISLGDSYYPHFAVALNILESFIIKHNGNIIDCGLKIQDPWENTSHIILNKINSCLLKAT